MLTRRRMMSSSVRASLLMAAGVVVAGGGAVLLAFNSASAGAPSTGTAAWLSSAIPVLAGATDHAKVVGPERCKDCHASAFAAWDKTKHQAQWDTLHKSPDAKKILAAMPGSRTSPRANELCISCHYTARVEGDSPKSKTGVSCESCHGPAAEWIDSHHDYGGDGATKESETPQHRALRWAKADQSGMIRKDRLYLIAENCVSCHTVPSEELVNKGQHRAGSEFELVAWSQGEVRHNFLDKPGGSREVNRGNTPQRLRVMYVVGKLVELEVTLRNLSAAKEETGEYFKFMVQRANRVLRDLDAVQRAMAIAEVKDALAAAPRHESGDQAGELRLAGAGSLPPLAEASAKVKTAAQRFAESNDGTELGALDALVPKEDRFKGAAHQP